MEMEMHEIMGKLKTTRLVFLGNGAHSRVFGLPKHPEIVLKVCNHTRDHWPHWALWCVENGYAGGFGPLVHLIKTFEWGYMAVMERLTYDAAGIAYQRIADARYMRRTWAYTDAGQLRDFVDHAMNDGWDRDWNGGNVLSRGITPVLVDPMSSERSLYKTRIGDWQRRTMLRYQSPLNEVLAA